MLTFICDATLRAMVIHPTHVMVIKPMTPHGDDKVACFDKVVCLWFY
jgi:hypothetical protein